jgi:hypothetical protein
MEMVGMKGSTDEYLRAWVVAHRWPALGGTAFEAFTATGSVMPALVARGALSSADLRLVHEQAARLRRGRQLVVFVELAARAGVDRERLSIVGRALGATVDTETLGAAAVRAGLLGVALARQLGYQARLAVDRTLAAQAALATGCGGADQVPHVPSAVFRLDVPRELREEAGTIVEDVLSASDERVAPAFSIPGWVDTSDDGVGTRLGPYVLVGRIGRGGSGVVHLAYRETEPSRPVALKVLEDASATAVGRFKREGLASALLQHENLVEVLDAGFAAGRHFLATEFVDGRDLGRVLQEEQQLAPVDALRVTERLLTGLAAAHAAGVIHRDVKPENVLVSADLTRVKLLDFGVSLVRGLGELQERVFTTAGAGFVGTPRYLSPEQAAGQPLAPRSDLYAVGLLLYEALSGEYPYDADAPLAYVSAHLEATPRPLAEAAPWLRHAPADLHRLVASLLAKDPDDRPRDARAAAQAVSSLVRRVAAL